MDTAATADRTPIRKKCNKNFITETFSKYSMISLSILLFRVNKNVQRNPCLEQSYLGDFYKNRNIRYFQKKL